ncbi:MAG: sigma-54 dependent transcriptional regulator [Calditerrivibrio sp.]|nr:sigma-54 dependent transcriptional regulator [Calditerrivibrio sp.]
MIKVLVVDDEENILWLLKEGLEDENIIVKTATNRTSAEKILENEKIDLCIVDIFLDEDSGLRLIKRWKNIFKNIYFIVITAQNTSSNVIESMEIGAIDFFPKPFNVTEIKNRVIDLFSKKIDFVKNKEPIPYDYQTNSRKMLEVYKVVGKVARTNISVLITGETGTGKEVIANMIHEKSNRREKPFVAVNVASIPKDLLESELFGHVKGAFTGAISDKIGKFEEADGGTIFLDEIGEMELGLQSKILRVLQDKEILRIGSNKKIKLNVRIIAATNRNLEQMVKEGSFREDLFYRLNVVEIKLPPLKERKEDIPMLVEHFLKKYSHIKEEVVGVSDEAIEVLKKYSWPGNIRELENTIQYAIVQSSRSVITVDDLPDKIKESCISHEEDSLHERLYDLAKQIMDYSIITGNNDAYIEYMKIVEKPLIQVALDLTKWNKSEASRILGINRNTLRSRIKELKLNGEKEE